MSITNAISTLLSAYHSTARKCLSSFCFLETADGRHQFVAKDGSLATVIRVDGIKILLGNEEYASIIERMNTGLSPYLDQEGHAVQVWFARDSSLSKSVVGGFTAKSRKVARQLGLELDDLFQERENHLPKHVTWEACHMVLWTRLSVLNREEIKSIVRDRKHTKGAPGLADAQDTSRMARELQDRHIAFVNNFLTDMREVGIRAAVLSTHDALRVIRSSVYPDLAGADWRAAIPTDPVRARMPELNGNDVSHLLWPRLEQQIFDREAEYVSPRVARIGAYDFAALDMTIGPQTTERFTRLLSRFSDESEIPWRVSFLIEGGGFRSLGIKNSLASVLQLTNPENRQIREAIEELQVQRLEGVTVSKCRVSFATWAPTGSSQEVEKRVTQLQRNVEGWGYCKASPLAGDPLEAVLSSAIGLDAASTAPAGLMPLTEILTMLPWNRNASPWKQGTLHFRTPDGRPWPYEPGSSLQDTNIDLIFGPPGKGKSVFLNSINLAMCLSPASLLNSGSRQLPRISIIDIGPSSAGLISLLKESLPPDRRHEAVWHRLSMTNEHAINPFDTQLGCRHPLPVEKAFLVNFLTLLGTEIGEMKPPAGLAGLVNAAIDLVYQHYDDGHRAGVPKTYSPNVSLSVDQAVQHHGLDIANGATTWWKVVDELFSKGDVKNAMRAQKYAVPLLEDMMTVLRDRQITDIFGEARNETGERITDACSRMISNAVREFPILQRPTKFDLGDARVVSLDLDEVAPKGGGAADKQTALMYMLARFAVARDFCLTPDSAALMPENYRGWHDLRIRRLNESPKRLVYDEFHRTSKSPMVREQVLSDMREGRKWGVQISLASQLLNDFDKGMVDLASGYWILGVANDRVAKEVGETFGLSPTAEHYLKSRLTGPGRTGSPILAVLSLKDGIHEHLLYLTLGPSELWAFSTTAEDSILRQQLYSILGPVEARRRLAARFASGSARTEMERRLSKALELDNTGKEPVEESIVNSLVEEIVNTQFT